MRLFNYFISFLICLFLHPFIGQGQKFSLEPIKVQEETSTHEKSEVPFSRVFQGRISNSIDSSVNHKFSQVKSFKHKQSIELKKIGIISQVGHYEIKNSNFSNLEWKTEDFNGFKIVEGSNYTISNITIEENLASNKVSKIFEDSKGNMWVGYFQGGISCLNSEFINHAILDSDIESQEVTGIIEYGDEIWVGTFGGGIYIIKGNQIKKLNKEVDFFSNHITSFCLTEKNELWISTFDNGVIKFSDGVFYHFPEMSKNYLHSIEKIVEDPIGNFLWLLDDNSNIFRLDQNNELSVVNFVNKNFKYKVNDIIFENELIILMDQARIGIIYEKIISILSIPIDENLTSIEVSNKGNIWLGTESGSLVIHKNEMNTILSSKHGMGAEYVSDLHLDNNGNILVASMGNGVLMTYGTSFFNVLNSNDDFYTSKMVISRFEDNLVFTSETGVSIMNKDYVVKHLNHPFLENIKGVTYFKNKIWAVSFKGIIEISNDSLFLTSIPVPSQTGYNSNTHISVQKNQLFVNNYNYGWFEFDDMQQKWYAYKDLKKLSWTTNLFIDSKNRKWISSNSGGITYFENNNQTKVLKNVSGINGHIEDNEGNVWIATTKGLYKYTLDNKLYKFKFENNTINQNFNSITYSKLFNGLWLGTNKNLVFIHLNNKDINVYNNQAGIGGVTFEKNQVADIGDMHYWVTNKSLVKFVPYIFDSNLYPPKIRINSINFDQDENSITSLKEEGLIDFHSITDGVPEKLVIYNFESNVNLIFTSNRWGDKSSLNYYYKINDNEDWIGPITNGVVSINNLKYQKYHIQVKAIGVNHAESNIVVYEFSVVKPFYQELWFVLFVIVFIISIGIFIFIKRSNFDFKNFNSYSTYSIYLKRLRFLALSFSIAFPVMEWIKTSVYEMVAPKWFSIAMIILLGLSFVVTSYFKRVSETSIAIFALLNSSIISLFLVYRVVDSNYAPIVSIELMTIIAFTTMVFDNMKLFLIYWIVLVGVFVFSIMELNLNSEKEVIYFSAVILMLIFSFVFHIFQVNKIGKVVFSDKILNTYDKLVLVYNNKGEVVYVNPYLNTFFQKEDNFILGEEWYRLRNCDEISTANIKEDIKKQILNNQPINDLDEMIFSSHLQSDRIIEWNFQIMENEFLMTTGTDVTLVRKQQEQITLLSKVSENVSNGVILRDGNDETIWCNKSFEDLVEMKLEELIGKRPSKCIRFADFYQNELQVFDQNFGKDFSSIEIPILINNGKVRWLLMNETVVKNENQEIIQFISIISDITENKKRDEEIKELSNVAQSVTNGVVITTPESIVTWCNNSFVKMSGYEIKDIIGKRPSQVLEVPKFFEEEFNEIVQDDPIKNPIKRIAHYSKNGELIWLLINTTPIYNDKNELIQIIEIVTDITKQKRQEEAFERLSLVAKHSQNPIMIMDEQMKIDWVNSAFEKSFGYQLEEIKNNVPGTIFRGDKTKNKLFKTFEIDLLQNNVAKGEFLLYDKFQNAIWMNVSADAVYNNKGKVTQYICVMQNIQEVKEAQAVIAEKNKDITDSIAYALRIQSALLPNLRLLKRNLPEHFVYYKPKDIVSGDFYYMEYTYNKVFLAIADCTGHGVPGAMMTSIGGAAINNAILDKKLEDPAKILNHVDNYVKNSLSATSDDLNDGMDIGMIVFDFENDCIAYSGAKRPLVYFDDKGTFYQIEGAKKSIGSFVYGEEYEFKTSKIAFQNITQFYCFTDGIQDQFGGEKRKKMYLKTLIDFLTEIKDESMENQGIKFEKMIQDWTFNFEIPQTDDMLIFGGKVNEAYFKKMKKQIAK